MSALAVTLAALAFTSPGANDDPTAVADAIEHDRGSVTAASYVARPAGATTAIGGAVSATTQPLDGTTMAFLSDGDATAGWTGAQSDNVSHIRDTAVRGGHDAVIASLRVSVPEEANCLTLGASFFSEDYGGSTTDDPRYFDNFLAELDPAAPWAAGDGDPSTLTAPANFALVRMPDGLKPVSAWVNSGSYSTEQAFGTGYDGTTQWHTFKVPVAPGVHQLDLSIFDRADTEYDSTVLVDNLRLIRRRPEACTYPGRDQFSSAEDLDAPTVTISASGGTLSGTASTGPNDARTVTVRAEGRSWTTSVRGDGSWSMTPNGLAAGDYEARASQVDAAGNEGLSQPQAFTVEASLDPAPSSTPTPPPGDGRPAAPQPAPGAGSPQPAPSAGPPSAAGAGAPAAVRCRVPKLRGKTLRAAGRALRRGHCRFGRLTHKRSHKGKRGRVLAQSPRAGTRRAAWARVKLTLRR
jgi:hypothetical protein